MSTITDDEAKTILHAMGILQYLSTEDLSEQAKTHAMQAVAHASCLIVELLDHDRLERLTKASLAEAYVRAAAAGQSPN
jgi:hypothetical protein